jgi:hypothetical protein
MGQAAGRSRRHGACCWRHTLHPWFAAAWCTTTVAAADSGLQLLQSTSEPKHAGHHPGAAALGGNISPCNCNGGQCGISTCSPRGPQNVVRYVLALCSFSSSPLNCCGKPSLTNRSRAWHVHQVLVHSQPSMACSACTWIANPLRPANRSLLGRHCQQKVKPPETRTHTISHLAGAIVKE